MLREAARDYWRFVMLFFFQAPGATQILCVSVLFSVGLGSTFGLIPQIAGDRYARLNHGYDGPPCSSLLEDEDSSEECQLGSDDARNAAAWANVGLSLFSLFSTPVVASLSDVRGRKQMVVGSILCNCLPAMMLLMMMKIPTFSPTYYYMASSLYGAIDFLTIMFAALADVIPAQDRAPAYGLLLASFYGGYSLAPSIPLLFKTHEQVAVFSLCMLLMGLGVSVLLLPETLSLENQKHAMEEQATNEEEDVHGCWTVIRRAVMRPLREISVLGSSLALGLVAAGAFFEEMVFASDDSLVIYYLESQLNVRDRDVASMYFVMGIVGIILQGFVLQPLVRVLGEKGLLILSFSIGVLYNLLYRIAQSKKIVYISLILSQVAGLNSSIVSSVASKYVSDNQHGRIQGALCALDSIAYAAGSLLIQFIYERTKDTWLGPGFMFLFTAFLYAIGTALISFIPDKTPYERVQEEEQQEIPSLK